MYCWIFVMMGPEMLTAIHITDVKIILVLQKAF